ncbi:MAG: hypothetical protein K9L56_13065 [Clostridiales bacterium]|nr:hypothetical protein [Clostridiales bacterium]
MEVYNTIYFDEGTCGWNGVYHFEKVTSKWIRHDQTISWDNARTGYWQAGTAYSGVHSGSCTEEREFMDGKIVNTPSDGIPTNGETYSMVPADYDNYDSDWYITNIDSFENCGWSKIDLHRGSETWEFEFRNTFDDNDS